MVQTIMLVAHVGVCLLIVALVLLQRGKGADAGAGFGAGASGTVFGARGSANFLSRTTAALAAAFFVTSLTLAFFANNAPTQPTGVIQQLAPGAGAGRGTQVGPAGDAPATEDLDAPPPLPAERTAPSDTELPPLAPSTGQGGQTPGNGN